MVRISSCNINRKIYKMNEPLKGKTTADDVISIYTTLYSAGIEIWIDGGWAVDALLGQQTRPHADVDILVAQQNIGKLRAVLEVKGFVEVPRDDASDYGFHLGNAEGGEVDVHGIIINEQGAWKHADPVELDMYPAESLSGRGVILNTPVNTLAPQYIVLFHSGYELQQKDYHDISALCAKYNLTLPEEYQHFVK